MSRQNADSDNSITKKSDVNEEGLPDILFDVVFPEFYLLGINSDKSGDALESKLLKED